MNASGVRGQQLLSTGSRFASSPGVVSRLVAPGFQKIINTIDAGLEKGSILARLPDGSTRMLGGRAAGFEAEITLNDWRALIRLATAGSIGWYQAFEAGGWESEDMVSLFAVMGDNARALGSAARPTGMARWIAKLTHQLNRNSRAGSKRNIGAHYDLGNDFYSSWLDPSMTYSSALGLDHVDLEKAQQLKIEAICERLGISEGDAVLEIGCGWGTLAGEMARRGGSITAISLSREQLAYARSKSPTINFREIDYRDISGEFDAIASVEMVEALGREYWPAFMDCIASNLKPGGRAAIQYISMADDLFEAYANAVDFIQAYVFPGGLLIKTSEFRELAEARGLQWNDHTSFGPDYAKTLQLWRERFDLAVSQEKLPQGFDQRFVRLWRYYLAYCEAGFRCGNVDVHQVTLARA